MSPLSCSEKSSSDVARSSRKSVTEYDELRDDLDDDDDVKDDIDEDDLCIDRHFLTRVFCQSGGMPSSGQLSLLLHFRKLILIFLTQTGMVWRSVMMRMSSLYQELTSTVQSSLPGDRSVCACALASVWGLSIIRCQLQGDLGHWSHRVTGAAGSEV